MENFKYIVLEGADGTGKTTLAKALKDELSGIFMYEPYGQTVVTNKLRELALQKEYKEEVNAEAREYLMLANRAISTEYVKNLLNNNEVVVQDRSAISGMVYASVASGYDFDDWWAIASKAFKVLPDVVVHVTTSKQKIDIVKGDIYDDEKEDFHNSIKATFPEVCDWFLHKKGVAHMNFENDFDKTPEQNAVRLIEELCDFHKFIDKN